MMTLRAAPLFVVFAAAPLATASAETSCLSSEEMRVAVRDGQVIPAIKATRVARDAAQGEVLRVRLCRDEAGLVYRVTTLAHDGRVAHVTIEGSSGKVSHMR
jgi:uncharacterized membrane protein YkoI